MRGLLGLGFPLGRAWWAKALWCLALCTLSNLVAIGIYLAGSAFSSQGLTAAGTLDDAPLRARQHGDHGVDDPRRALPHGAARHARGHLLPAGRGRSWVGSPGRWCRCPQLFPPSASMVIPTSFIPVLPSGEPLAATWRSAGRSRRTACSAQAWRALRSARSRSPRSRRRARPGSRAPRRGDGHDTNSPTRRRA